MIQTDFHSLFSLTVQVCNSKLYNTTHDPNSEKKLAITDMTLSQVKKFDTMPIPVLELVGLKVPVSFPRAQH